MGLNPGGKGHTKIRDHIDNMLTKKTHAYLDDEWPKGNPKGQSPLQKRASWLLEELGYNIRNVFATNLMFMTSKNAVESNFELAGICWVFHQYVLEIVKPKMILSFGNSKTSPSPYRLMRALFNGEKTESEIESGHRPWKCRAFSTELNGRKTHVVGLPHLSRYKPNGKTEVVKWLNSMLECNS